MIAIVKGKVVGVRDAMKFENDKEDRVEVGILMLAANEADVVRVKMAKTSAPKMGADVEYPVSIRGGKNGAVYASAIQ
jgi:hypothetical protein